MRNREGFIDRRKHKRFKVKGGAFAVATPDYNKPGQIKDISEGGLAFQFITNDEQTTGWSEIEIFSSVDDFYIKKIPVRTVLNSASDNTASSNPTPLRQVSMKFGKLNHPQKLLLNFFIRKYACK
jgi:hypothetical protein